MPVEARPEQLPELVPAAGRVRRGMEREECELAAAHPREDRLALRGRPGRVADREERQNPRSLERAGLDLRHARRVLEGQPGGLRKLGHRDRGLAEHAVRARHAELWLRAAWAGGVRRDVGDVEQRAAHRTGCPSASASSTPPPAADS